MIEDNMSNEIKPLQEISNLLFDLFIANPQRYAKQLPDGNYNTVYKRLSPAKILHSLQNQGSILTYQEAQGFIKWVCLDFDISKNYQENYERYFSELLEAIKETLKYLNDKQIPYLLESSGRRGFHIWLIFDFAIRKSEGYAIAKYLKDMNKKLSGVILIDLYPKTPIVNPKSKGIGLGVKLPLSLHRKSGKYAFFVKDIEKFNPDRELWPTELSESFISEQLNIVENYTTVNIYDIRNKIQYESYEDDSSLVPYIKTSSLMGVDGNLPALDEVLVVLKTCHCLRNILSRFPFDMNEQERKIMVGILGRITSSKNSSYGKELLKDFFSRLPNYIPKVTDKKIELLSGLYPPTCKSICESLNCVCLLKCDGISTPSDLLKELKIFPSDEFRFGDVNEVLIKKSANAQKKYTYINDEVPYFYIRQDLSNVNFEEIINKYKKILSGSYKIKNDASFKFIRKEDESKDRILFSLNSENKLLSTISLYQLNTIWQDCLSPNSYAYQIQESYQGGLIFKDWLFQWHLFIKQISDIIYDEENAYDEYYLIKIDLSSFYDTIDQLRLRVKLLDEPIKIIADRLEQFTEDEKINYTNLIQYFLEICKITNPERGVPQGPAYARYLAEIYMIGLDKVIEDHIIPGHEFYFRYVDDIFVFIQSKEKAEALDIKIAQELAILELTKNTSKSLTLCVKEFRNRDLLDRYQDENKYFIDQIEKQKSIATKGELDQAIELAQSMINESEWGLKDHFRFIFSHFSENETLNQAKKEIASKVIESTYGRGSLYRIFFDKYYFKEIIELLNIEDIIKMNDLALANYLNSLHSIDKTISLPQNYIADIIQARSDIPRYIKITIIAIALKYKQPVRDIVGTDYDLLNSLLKSEVEYEIKETWFDIDFGNVFIKISEYQDVLDNLILYIKTNKISFNLIRNIAEYFWTRTTEEIDSFIVFKLNLNPVYNLLCLFSIVSTKDKEAAFKSVWIKFLSQNTEFDNLLISENWFDKIADEDLSKVSKATWALFVVANKEGGFLDHLEDKLKLINRFRDILFVLSTNNRKLLKIKRKLKAKIYEIIKADIFLSWITDPQTTLYPNDGTCLLNISENGLVVLQKNNEYLIKNLNKDLEDYDYIERKEEISDKSVVVLAKNSRYDFLDKQIRKQENDFLKLNKILVLKKTAQKFKEANKYNYPNFFLKDTSVLRSNNFPLIPYYSNCRKIISKRETVVDNSETGFYRLLLELLAYKEIKFTSAWKWEEAFQLFSDGDNTFFPTHIHDYHGRITFLEVFYNFLEGSGKSFWGYRFIHQAWSSALQESLTTDDKLDKFFSIYFKTFEKKQLNQLIYKLVRIIDDANLKCYMESIENSIELDFVKIGIQGMKNSIIEALSLNGLEVIDLGLFEKKEFEIKKNEITPGTINYLWGENDIFNPDRAYLFSNMEKSSFFDEITKDNIDRVLMKKSYDTYIYQTDDAVFIVFTPRYLKKIKDSIQHQYKWLNPGGINPYEDIRHRLLWDHEANINKVYDKIERLAEHLITHYDTEDILKNKTRIINWLLLFNEYTLKDSVTWKYMKDNSFDISSLYETLLEVALAHNIFTADDIENFESSLNNYLSRENVLFLPLKKIDDLNGFHALLTKKNQIRNEKITGCVKRIERKNKKQDTLVIIHDLFLTGTQSVPALKFYWGIESKKENMYHKISEKFIKKIKTFNKVIFFSLTTTKIFKGNDFTFLSSKQQNSIDHVSFQTLEEFNFSDINLSKKKKDLFECLIQDIDLVEKIFKIGAFYRGSIKDLVKIKTTNTVLRLKSTTKTRFIIFTVPPRMEGVESLFERRKELNEP